LSHHCDSQKTPDNQTIVARVFHRWYLETARSRRPTDSKLGAFVLGWRKAKPKADAGTEAKAPSEDIPPVPAPPSQPEPSTGAAAPTARTALEPITLGGRSHQQGDPLSSVTADQGAAAFGKIVSVLMRNEQTGQYHLADLAWLVAPPLAAGTYAIIDATSAQTRATTSAAVALWAMVSPEVDQRLSARLTVPIWLPPHEWQSGTIPWLIAAAGEPPALQKLLQHLLATRFKGQTVKMRTQGPDGRAAIGVLTGAV
jgi:hemolysin-activating ACP:hemolysin acyltransferase